MIYYLYCAIKKKRLVYDTLYSIISLDRSGNINQDVRIVIVTDFQEEFIQEIEKYQFPFAQNIIFENVKKSTVDEWLSDGYIFNVKIQAIKLFMNKYKNNVLFLDGDMLIFNRLESLYKEISCDRFIMFRDLPAIILLFFDHYEDYEGVYLKNKQIYFDNLDLTIPMKFKYFLSGVLGLPYNRELLNEVDNVCASIYSRLQYRATEEMAFSIVLQQHGHIKTVDKIITNYSNCDYIRYIFAYCSGIFFSNDKERFMEYMYCCDIDVNKLAKIEIDYDDFLYFYLFLKLCSWKKNYSMNDFLKIALSDPFFSNTITDMIYVKKRLEKSLEKFQKVLL